MSDELEINASYPKLIFHGQGHKPLKITIGKRETLVRISKVFGENMENYPGYHTLCFVFTKQSENNRDLYEAKFDPLSGKGRVTKIAQGHP